MVYLDKVKKFYYKYHNYREDGKVKRKYLGRAKWVEVMMYKIRKVFNK